MRAMLANRTEGGIVQAIRNSVESQAVRFLTRAYYVATYNGRTEFYSGVTNGSRVIVHVESQVFTSAEDRAKASVSVSVQSLENRGGWLSLYDRLDSLSDIEPLEESRMIAASYFGRPIK